MDDSALEYEGLSQIISFFFEFLLVLMLGCIKFLSVGYLKRKYCNQSQLENHQFFTKTLQIQILVLKRVAFVYNKDFNTHAAHANEHQSSHFKIFFKI